MAKTKNTRAKSLRYRLLKVLSGGKPFCAECKTNHYPDLELDHVNGITWDARKVNYSTRIYRFWREYRNDVPLQVLCHDCNVAKEHRAMRFAKNFVIVPLLPF